MRMIKCGALLFAILIPVVLLAAIQPVSAKIGTGQLYVYIDSGYTTLAPQDDKGFYEIFPGQEVYIQIAGITEFSLGEGIIVKICFDYTYTVGPLEVKILTSGDGAGLAGVGDASQEIMWEVGQYDGGYMDIPICETITVHYKDDSGTGPDYLTFDTQPPCIVAHLHVIPETPIGTIGAAAAMIIALALFSLKKKEAVRIPRKF